MVIPADQTVYESEARSCSQNELHKHYKSFSRKLSTRQIVETCISSYLSQRIHIILYKLLSLASFFYQKIVSLKDSTALKLQGSPTPFDFDQPHSGEVLSDFTPVTPAEVSQLLWSMSNKSSPLDYIPTSLLKSCADTFFILISHLADLSFTQATFPSKFKLALILPLLKKPGLPKSDLANFRPISRAQLSGGYWSNVPIRILQPGELRGRKTSSSFCCPIRSGGASIPP